MLAVLFIATTILCVLLVARIPSGKTLLIWLPLAFFIQLGFVALVYGLFILLNVGYSLFMGIAANVLLSLFACIRAMRPSSPKTNGRAWMVSWSIPKSEKPFCDKRDMVVWCCLAIVCIVCFIKQFGIPPQVSFLASDAAAHDYASYAIATGEPGRGAQYLSYLVSGSMMAVFDFAITRETSFIIFEIMETFLLFFSGTAFYSVLATICKKLSTPFIALLTILYLLGYPLNNMLFGFSYLGIAVTVITLLVFACLSIDAWGRKAIAFGSIALLLFEVAISYSLFAPPVYLGVFIFLIVKMKRDGDKASRIVAGLFAVFTVPSLLAMVLVFAHYFINSGQNFGDVIGSEGGIFRDLYASFIFVVPFSVHGFCRYCKTRRIDLLVLLTSLFVVYSLALFVLCALDLVSTYYFYKLYYVLWMQFFLFAGCSVQYLSEKTPGMLVSYASVWLIVFLLAFTGLDAKLTSRPRLNPHPVAESLFSIYVYNFDYIGARRWTDDTMKLLDKADELKDTGYEVALTTNDLILRWWSALYGGSYYDFRWWGYTDEGMVDALRDYDYVVVSYDDPLNVTKTDHSFIEALDAAEQYDYDAPENIVFANEEGLIVKAPK